MIDVLLPELSHAFRRLGRAKALAVTLTGAFALGSAAGIVVFGITRGVLLKPLGFPSSERVVATLNQYPNTKFGRVGASIANYFEQKEGIRAFEEVAAIRFSPVIVGVGTSVERVAAAWITPSFFSLVRVTPAMGWLFAEGTIDSDARDVAVISDKFWRRHFGGSASAIGSSLRIDGAPVTIAGILPAHFRYPSFPSAEPDIWLPLPLSSADGPPSARHHTTADVVARLRTGFTIEQAQQEVSALNAALATSDPNATWAREAGFWTQLVPLRIDAAATVRPVLNLLQTGTLCLLLIGAANLINLQLIRVNSRQQEISIRYSLGAGNIRIAWSIMAETLAIAVVGSAVGVMCGIGGLRAALRLASNWLPRAQEVTVDAQFVFAVVAAALATAVTVSVPAIVFGLNRSVASRFMARSHGCTPSRCASKLRQLLVVVQVALAFVLLAFASMLAVSLHRVVSVPTGIHAEGVISGILTLPAARYRAAPERFTLIERLSAAVESYPAVSSVGISSALPFASIGGSSFTVEGSLAVNSDSATTHYLTMVGRSYFATLGIRLVTGRNFTAADSRSSESVCIVDEAFARTYWPDSDPVGHRVFRGAERRDGDQGMVVVGVVKSVLKGDPAKRPVVGTVYLPLTPRATGSFFYMTLKVIHPNSVSAESLAKIARDIDPDIAISDVQFLNTRVEDAWATRRIALFAGVAFAGVALLVSLVGIYAAIAFEVAQRTREIGLRMSVGATPWNIVTLFAARGARLSLVGLAIGVSAAFAAGQMVRALLFGVSPADSSVFLFTGSLLGSCLLVACLIPAIRASRVSPMAALKHD